MHEPQPQAPADHLAFFRAHPPFDALGEEALTCVVREAAITYLPQGHRVLVQGGEPARFMYLIRKGAVRLERDGQLVMVLEDGDLFGFPSLTSGDPPAFDVVTDEDTLAYRLPGGICSEFLHDAAWTDFLLQKLQERLRRTAVQAPTEGGMGDPVAELVQRAPEWLEPSQTVRAAATIMRDRGVSSVLVSGREPGIVTDRDLRGRVLAEGRGPDTLLDRVASRPLLTLPGTAPVHEAMAFMLRHQVHHLPLTDEEGVTGVVSNGDLLRHQSGSPLHLGRRLARFDDADALHGYGEEVAATVHRLYHQGVDALRIGRVIAGLNDTLVRSALRLAEGELGPPPCPYEWIVFGSEGRMEQTLLTDQDNALVFRADPDPDPGHDPDPDPDPDRARSEVRDRYFHELARRVVGLLLRAGFPRCKGGYMATRWTLPLDEWRTRFERWVELEEPTALLDAANFFDFRPVRGQLPLDTLNDILDDAGRNQIFLAHFAAASLRFRPPLGLFGRLKDHDGLVDLKRDGIIPVVGLARVYGLAAGARSRSTTARLQHAADAGALAPDDAATLSEAFAFLLRLRLRAQLTTRREGDAPSNEVRLDDLSTLERRHLKEAFVVIRDAQDALAQRYQTERLG